MWYVLFQHLGVFDNVVCGLRVRKIAPAELETRVMEIQKYFLLMNREEIGSPKCASRFIAQFAHFRRPHRVRVPYIVEVR